MGSPAALCWMQHLDEGAFAKVHMIISKPDVVGLWLPESLS